MNKKAILKLFRFAKITPISSSYEKCSLTSTKSLTVGFRMNKNMTSEVTVVYSHTSTPSCHTRFIQESHLYKIITTVT